jgi:hypothetical protein
MRKSPRRTDADYIKFPPYYNFRAHPNQSSRNDLRNIAWGVAVVAVLAGLVLIAGLLIFHSSASHHSQNGTLFYVTDLS